MNRFFRNFAILSLAACVILPPLWAQGRGDRTSLPGDSPQASAEGPADSFNPFLGSVAAGESTGGEIGLSLGEALSLGLQNNLGVLLSGHGRRLAEGNNRAALSRLLPHVSAAVRETVQQNNLAALGFSGFPGIPQIIGPFSVFDVRAQAGQELLNLPALRRLDAATESLKAADLSYENARDLVVLTVVGLYLQAVAGKSRIDAARAQFETAEALYDQAVNFKEAGVVPAIEVLRAQVEMQSEQQRLIYLENRFDKEKLNLARAIGLPLGQAFRLTDEVPFRPLPSITPDQAIEQALVSRADYQGAQARLRAASRARAAAEAERLPTADVDFNYGTIGRNPGNSHGTFALAANLHLPIFEGGRISAEVVQADSVLRERQDELDNLRGQIQYDVRAAFLDLRSAESQVAVAETTIELAHEQLEQARDRFAAGVATNIEVVQAQAAVATANENLISSLLAYNLAKAELARAVGGAEKTVREFLLGETK